MDPTPSAQTDSQIGYILKGFARTSETFITHEIAQLEKLGLNIKIFSLLELTGQAGHAVVDEVRARPRYLPPFSSTSESHPLIWIVRNLFPYLKSHGRLAAICPRRYFKTLREALSQSFALGSGWLRPDATSVKEFLQAGYIAEHTLAEGRIQHFHAHFCHTATTVAMYAGALAGLPFSFTAHAKDIYVPDLNPGDLLNRKLRSAKFAVTCTAANRRHLESLEPLGAPIHTIYHGLDTARFSPIETKLDSEPPLILSVGRMVEKKGFPDLIEACRLLNAREIPFRCLIVGGGGPEAERVSSLIKTYGLENIIEINPAVSQEELREIYGRAAVFVLPCRIAHNLDRDGVPNVLVEAMAMGLPVVSTNISGVPELIDSSVDGLLVPEQNPEALADALATLIQQPGLRRRLGATAREKVLRSFRAGDHIMTLHKLLLACLAQDRSLETRPLGEKAEAKP